jgi:5-methyltetrahydrofolate--homocysteine methyltransferase
MEKQAMLKGIAEAVVAMNQEGIEKLVEAALAAGIGAQEIVLNGLSEGMRIVGQKFQEGEVFMPEVLVSCDTYYAGLKLLEPLIKQAGGVQSKGKMIIGTIYGDIHTVGKDVAVPVFRAAGFEVIDLGVDVPDEKFVEAIREHKPQLVGLGTYMTATFMHTAETVKAIKEAGLRDQVKIICGGPAVDARTARRMGADDASDNAWEAVKKMEALVAELKQ